MSCQPGIQPKRYEIEPGNVVEILYFPALITWGGRVIHGFATRKGGVSEGPCATLNCGGSEEAAENVLSNRRSLCRTLGMDPSKLVGLRQVHGTQVVRVGSGGTDSSERSAALKEGDALITREVGLPLGILTADCLPIILVDPVSPAVGIVHAGWRGTLQGVLPQAIREMERAFGSSLSDLWAGIGPGIGPCCYEVGEEVASLFQGRYPGWSEWLCPKGEGHYRLDLARANLLQLAEMGIPEGQIELAGLCTCCHPSLFFSHRREQGKTGRMLNLVALSP